MYQAAPRIFSYLTWVCFNFNTTFSCVLFFLFWNAVWGKSSVRGKAGSQPEGFVIGSGFSVVGSQRHGEGRKPCNGLEPISSHSPYLTWVWFSSGTRDGTLSIPHWISALSIFKENVMGSDLLLNFRRGFENFPVAVFLYSHFFFLILNFS